MSPRVESRLSGSISTNTDWFVSKNVFQALESVSKMRVLSAHNPITASDVGGDSFYQTVVPEALS